MDRQRFITDTLEWLNRRLLAEGASVTADTPLFEDGLVDSIRILRIIAWTETAIGRVIADREIRMDNFRTVRRMADVFVGGG